MGGTAKDSWTSVAVGNGHVYAGGFSTSTDGDFPAGLPGEMSAFVPGDPQREMFVMQLDVAAPIVQVADTDITVPENTPVTLAATTSAGTITWYESGEVLGTGNELPDHAELGYSPDFRHRDRRRGTDRHGGSRRQRDASCHACHQRRDQGGGETGHDELYVHRHPQR